MKNIKNKTLYQQLQEIDKKYLKIKKNLYLQSLHFSHVRRTTICHFSKMTSFELEVFKKSRIKHRLAPSFRNFLPSQRTLLFLHKKLCIECKASPRTAALGYFTPFICYQTKFESKKGPPALYGMQSFLKDNFTRKSKICFRDVLKTKPGLNYCLSPQKMENQNNFISQGLQIKSTTSWKKAVVTIYYLLIAYKKTMRVKLNYYFNNSTNLQFFLAISPFLAYFVQTSIEKYELKYQQNTFFNKSLPGLKTPIQELNWETYAYTKYAIKMSSNFITQVNSVDDSFFISLNPHWQFKQKQLSTATFESPTSITKWSFLPSRYFYQMLQENRKQDFTENSLLCIECKATGQGGKTSSLSFVDWGPKKKISDKAAVNPHSEKNEQEQNLKTISLGFQQKSPKAASEIRFWKNFKFVSFEKKSNFTPQSSFSSRKLITESENQLCVEFKPAGQSSEFYQKSEKNLPEMKSWGRNKLQNLPITKFSKESNTTDNFQTLKTYQLALKKQLALNSEWQIFFNELDDIPIKLNSVFQHETKTLKRANQTLQSPLLFSFSDLTSISTPLSSFDSSLQISLSKPDNLIKDFEGDSNVLTNRFSFTKFKESFNLLESNYKSTLYRLTPTRESNLKLLGSNRKFNSNLISFKDKSKFFSKRLDLPQTLTQNSLQFTTQNVSLNSNLLKKELFLLKKAELIGIETIHSKSFKESDQTWIQLLTKIFNRPILQNSALYRGKPIAEPLLFLERNLQYNIDFGFSQLANLIKLNVLTPNLVNSIENFAWNAKLRTNKDILTETVTGFKLCRECKATDQETPKLGLKVDLLENKGGVAPISINRVDDDLLRSKPSSFEILPKSISLIWQNTIREDLRSPLPSWITEAKNQTLHSPRSSNTELKTQMGASPCLLKLENFETFFSQYKLKFDNITNNALLKKPDSILGLLKKSDIRVNQTFEEKKSFGLKFNNLRKPALSRSSSFPTREKSSLAATKKKFSFVQRKVSGYLYPDTFRDTIFTNKGLFHFNKQINCVSLQGKSEHSSTGRYERGFQTIISPSLLNHTNKTVGSQSSLIQVYQPLIQNSIGPYSSNFFNDSVWTLNKNSKDIYSKPSFPSREHRPQAAENVFLEKQVGSILNFDKLQTLNGMQSYGVGNSFNRIEPDQSFTAKKEFFFGVPTDSPLYGITLKEYKEKFEKRKKDIQKNHLIAPYENSLNFIIQSNSNLKCALYPKSSFLPREQSSQTALNNPNSTGRETFFRDDETRREDLGALHSMQSFGESSMKLDPKSILNEITKGATFSNGFLEKRSPFSSFKSPLITKNIQNLSSNTLRNDLFDFQKKEKNLNFQQRAIPYKTHFNYTKLRVLPSNLNELEKFLIRSPFSINLYEPISLKTWTLSSQLGFAFIVLKLASILYNEYREEMGYYINEFAVFFNEYEKNNFLDFLDFFNPKENFRVINKTNKKFSDLVGGRFLLTEFGEVILLLRNSRKVFYKIGISKPQIVSFDTSFHFLKFLEPLVLKGKQKICTELCIECKEGKAEDQKQILNLSKVFLNSLNHFPIVRRLQQRDFFVEKSNLKLANFIPKGILLVGPPGTGKTLLVKALSGEAGVPVIVESGKMLTTNMENNGAERLKDLFKAAREMSPCILFLDEVDTIGQKRENVLSTFAAGEKLCMECKATENQIPNTINLIYLQNGLTEKLNSSSSENLFDFHFDICNPILKLQIVKNSTTKKNQELNDLKIQLTNQKISSGKQKQQDLIMLTQLLCELDGLNKTLHGMQSYGQEIIVIGATNRPATLDSALTRPGRFGKVIYLDLPGKQKRFELLKFYSHSKKDSFLLLNQQAFEFESFIPTFSSFSSSEVESKQRLTSRSSNLKVSLGQTFSKSENFLKMAFSKMPKFVFPFISLNLEDPKIFKGAIKTNKNLGVDENINWNYFANQTVGLSAAHLASAMNRSALKAIYIYLSQTQNFAWNAKLRETTLFNVPFVKNGLKKKKNFRLKIENRLKTLKLKKEVKQTFLNEKSDLLFQLINMSKHEKLRLVAQSGLGNSEILNQFNLISQKNADQTIKKQQPLHNFETIEYGIQTISTMTTSLQLKVTKGKKVNKTIIGQLARDDFRSFAFYAKFFKKASPSAALHGMQSFARGQTEKTRETFLNFPFSRNFAWNIKFPRKRNLNSFIKTKQTGLSPEHEILPKDGIQNFGKGNKGSLKRNRFYQKHRRYLRTLAFLGEGSDQSFTLKKDQNLEKNELCRECKATGTVNLYTKFQHKGSAVLEIGALTEEAHFSQRADFSTQNLVSLTFSRVKILSRYVNRIIRNQSLGWVLLSNSTCLIQNSFFIFSLQNQTQKNLNSIYYHLLFLNKNRWLKDKAAGMKKDEPRTVLKWQKFNLINQNSLFGDSLFINRSAYYLSGKALINVTSKIEKQIDEPISLWSFTGSFQTRQKKSSDSYLGVTPQGKSSKLFLTKIQFENFILSLIAGKASETLMLSNQLGVQKKNESNIGIRELKEVGVLIKLMGDKYFFYSQKQLNHKQININLLENEKQINQDEFLFLKELATLFEIQNKTLTYLPSNPLRSYDQFQSIDQPWWQLKSIHLLSSFNLKYGEWYRLFLAEEQQNFRNIEWVAPDTYFHNQLNNSHLILNKTNLLLQKGRKNHYFVNHAFVSKYIESSKLNWNQLQLLESESVASYFLFESFNKICNLLDNNREIIDSLVYSLVCHESLRDFEILNTYGRYFK